VAYVRPTELEDTLACLAAGDRRIAAGCTDLFPATSRQTLTGDILDITAIPSLRGIARTEGGYRIGTATTWTDILKAELPVGFDQLKLAAREVGSVQIQNAATIGGNLCNASPAADGVPALLVLDVAMELSSQSGTRTLPLTEFITGPRQTALRSDELLTAVLIPDGSTAGNSVFLKLGARKYLVISIAMVAARILVENGRIADAAIAVGACSAVASRLSEIEAGLIGQAAGPDLANSISDDAVARYLDPISDPRGDAAYRSAAAAELVRRAISQLLREGQIAA